MTPIITIKKHIATLEDRIMAYEDLARTHEVSNPSYASTMRDRIQEIQATLAPIIMQMERMVEVVPLTGVIGHHLIDLDMILSVDDVPIGWQSAILEHSTSCIDPECRKNNHEYALDGAEDLDHLCGDWKFDPNTAKYDIDRNGPAGFALIKRETVYQVVWSKTTTWVSSLCSPVYPNQANVCMKKEEGQEHVGILAYTLPEDYWYD